MSPVMRKQEIQSLVDDHARIGYSNGQIKLHLRELHNVLLTEVIPPPTKIAQKARKRYLTTGVIDERGMKTMAATDSSGGFARFGPPSKKLPQ